jgi:hypothetical protein
MRTVSACTTVAVAVIGLSGCGTFVNLKDPPSGIMFCGTGACYPFGGVVRSGLLAAMGSPLGVSEVISGDLAICLGQFGDGVASVGAGMLLTAAGLGAIVDTPLSLAGDILTFPVAYARCMEYSWATWWGEQSTPNAMKLLPWPADDSNKTQDGVQPPNN